VQSAEQAHGSLFFVLQRVRPGEELLHGEANARGLHDLLHVFRTAHVPQAIIFRLLSESMHELLTVRKTFVDVEEKRHVRL